MITDWSMIGLSRYSLACVALIRANPSAVWVRWQAITVTSLRLVSIRGENPPSLLYLLQQLYSYCSDIVVITYPLYTLALLVVYLESWH